MTIRLASVDMEFVKDASSPSPPHRSMKAGATEPIGQSRSSTTIRRISREKGRTQNIITASAAPTVKRKASMVSVPFQSSFFTRQGKQKSQHEHG